MWGHAAYNGSAVGPVPRPGGVKNMATDQNQSRPKRLRRLGRVWPEPGRYFLTFCASDRQPVLANAKVHDRVQRFISDSLNRYGGWVHGIVLMPDHIHLIVSMASGSVVLGEWIKAFKAVVANREFRWQPGFFDHVLRSEESLSEKWDYIRMNPVRAGLVKRPEDWAFSVFFDSRTGQEIPPRGSGSL